MTLFAVWMVIVIISISINASISASALVTKFCVSMRSCWPGWPHPPGLFCLRANCYSTSASTFSSKSASVTKLEICMRPCWPRWPHPPGLFCLDANCYQRAASNIRSGHPLVRPRRRNHRWRRWIQDRAHPLGLGDLMALDILKVVKAPILREMIGCSSIIEAENTEAERKGRKRDIFSL